MKKLFVSVVIPAYNEEKIIGQCLDAFVKQVTTYAFEIIIVDNNSTDKTLEIISSFAKKLPLRIVFEKEKGRGRARRAGFAKARGDIILSTDADTIVPTNWIEDTVNTFKDPKVIAVTGPSKVRDSSAFINAIISRYQPTAMRIYRLFVGHYWLSGFNFAIRKHVYEKSGGFRSIDAQEDTDLSFRVSKLGKIMFSPLARVTVSGRRFKNGIVKGLFDYTQTYVNYFIFRRPSVVLSDER